MKSASDRRFDHLPERVFARGDFAIFCFDQVPLRVSITIWVGNNNQIAILIIIFMIPL